VFEAGSEETRQLVKRLMLTIEAAQDASRRAERAVAMAEALLLDARFQRLDLSDERETG
jgi:hypothetical protein